MRLFKFMLVLFAFVLVNSTTYAGLRVRCQDRNYFEISTDGGSNWEKYFPLGWYSDMTSSRVKYTQIPPSGMNTMVFYLNQGTIDDAEVLFDTCTAYGLNVILDLPYLRGSEFYYYRTSEAVNYSNRIPTSGDECCDGWSWDPDSAGTDSVQVVYSFHWKDYDPEYEDLKTKIQSTVLYIDSTARPNFELNFNTNTCYHDNMLDVAGRNTPWVNFKVKMGDSDSSEFVIFIAKTHCTDTTASPDSTVNLYVKLNSKSYVDIPDSVEYYHDDTITISLQDEDFFWNDGFPLYGRNPVDDCDGKIILSYPDTLHEWYIVFAMLDSIINEYTDPTGPPGPFAFDSVTHFTFIGRDYYLNDFGYSKDFGQLDSIIDTVVTHFQDKDNLFSYYTTDEPSQKAGRNNYAWAPGWEKWWDPSTGDTLCGFDSLLTFFKHRIDNYDTFEHPVTQVQYEKPHRTYELNNLLQSTYSFPMLDWYPIKDGDIIPPSSHVLELTERVQELSNSLDSIGLNTIPFVAITQAFGDVGYSWAGTPTFEEQLYMTYAPIVHGSRGILYWSLYKVTDSGDESDTLIRYNIHEITNNFVTQNIDEIIMSDPLDSLISVSPAPDCSSTYIEKDINWLFRTYDADTVIAGDEYYLIMTNDICVKDIADKQDDTNSAGIPEYDIDDSFYCHDSIIITLDSLENAYWRIVDIKPYDDDGYPDSWPGNDHAENWGYGNSICIDGNSFTDDFRPYDVHIYKIYKNPPIVLKEGWNLISIPYDTGKNSLKKILGEPSSIWTQNVWYAPIIDPYMEVSDSINIPGISYWVLSEHDTVIQMNYQPINKYITWLDSKYNWNMIGSIHSSHVWNSSTYCFNPDPEGYFDWHLLAKYNNAAGRYILTNSNQACEGYFSYLTVAGTLSYYDTTYYPPDYFPTTRYLPSFAALPNLPNYIDLGKHLNLGIIEGQSKIKVTDTSSGDSLSNVIVVFENETTSFFGYTNDSGRIAVPMNQNYNEKTDNILAFKPGYYKLVYLAAGQIDYDCLKLEDDIYLQGDIVIGAGDTLIIRRGSTILIEADQDLSDITAYELDQV